LDTVKSYESNQLLTGKTESEKMTTSRIATVEVPFEALVKELGTKRAIEFISEIRKSYGDSVVELRKATEKLTIEQVEAEIKTLKKQGKILDQAPSITYTSKRRLANRLAPPKNVSAYRNALAQNAFFE